jgi:hypothetical protein
MDRVLLANLMEEVRLTLELMPNKDETDFEYWKNLLKKGASILSKAKYPSISVSFDMGWQQRSSGKVQLAIRTSILYRWTLSEAHCSSSEE